MAVGVPEFNAAQSCEKGEAMFELQRISRSRKKLHKAFAKAREELREGKAQHEEYERLEAEEAFEYQMLDTEENLEVTRRLLGDANRHYVPVPKYRQEPYWEQGYQTDRCYLTQEGVKAVRNELRDFWKWRLEVISQVGTILIGVVGAVTGLIAVICR